MTQVSPGGNLHSLEPLGFPMYYITKDGKIWSVHRKRFLVPKVHRCKYLFIRLQHESGKFMNRYIHRLVAMMFIPTTDVSLQIDHIDGNKHNNNVKNLRWVTNRENAHAAMKKGLMPHAVFMSDEIVHAICKALQNGESVISISKRTGYPYHAISAIRLRRNWTHISEQYTFPEKRDRKVLSDEDVHRICQLIVKGKTDREINAIFQTDQTLIHRIRTGRNFSRISKNYFTSEKICRTTEQSVEVGDKKPQR